MKDEEGNLFYNVVGDEIRIGWFASVGAFRETPNSPILIITGKTTNNFKQGDVIKFRIANNPLCEFADENGDPIENVFLKTYPIEHSYKPYNENSTNSLNDELFIFPNPAQNDVNIRYSIVKDEFVNISIFNVLGEKVGYIVNKQVLKGIYNSDFDLCNFDSGVYICKMVLDGKSVVVKRLVVSKN